MFEFYEERIGDGEGKAVTVIVCRDSLSGAFLEIIPELGGTIRQIGLSFSRQKGPVRILREDSPGEIRKNPWFRGRFLFPFNDRILSGNYSFDDRDYYIPVNDPESGDAIHGFIYNRPAEIQEMSGTKDAARLCWRIETGGIEGYPFKAVLDTELLFTGRKLMVNLKACNRGDSTLPFSIGWHPYFRLEESRIDPFLLKIPATSYVEVDRKLIPTGRLPGTRGGEYDFSAERAIGGIPLDLGFTGLEGDVTLSDGETSLVLKQDRDFFPCLQAFIPPGRDSIALEPVSAGANSFNMPELGLQRLEPGDSRSGWFSVELRKA